MDGIQLSLFGKTCPEPSRQTTEKTSDAYLKNSLKFAGGGYTVPRPDKGKWRSAGEILGDDFSVAWRQLDAQYWGVPQRRKRIYLVADFRGERAGEILFEREGLRGHPAPGGATGQGAAADAARGAGGSRGIECLNPWDAQSIRQYSPDGVFPALGANSGGGQNRAGVCFAQNQRDELRDLGEKAGALAAEQGMHQQNFVALKCLNPWDCQSKRIYQPDGSLPYTPGNGLRRREQSGGDVRAGFPVQQQHEVLESAQRLP